MLHWIKLMGSAQKGNTKRLAGFDTASKHLSSSSGTVAKSKTKTNKKHKNTEGPWPECLWMSGEECANFIQTQVSSKSAIKIDFVHQKHHDEEKAFSRSDPNRIVIVLNEHDNVWEVPARGRRRRR